MFIGNSEGGNSRCWASSLGSCNQMSGEHVFSNSIFKTNCSCSVMDQGVKRINNGDPTYNAEKSNILCRSHYSLLSPLDATIGKIARFQAEANNKNFQGTLVLEGELLERWLIKTLINSAAAGWASSDKQYPSDSLVNAVFGLK